MLPTVPRYVVLMSGGLDSTVALASTVGIVVAAKVKVRDHVHGLLIQYDQRAYAEEHAADAAAEHYGISPVQRMRVRGLVGSTLLANSKEQVPLDGTEGPGIPSTFVPARNMILLSMAANFAKAIDAQWIVTGFNTVDYSGYTDCRMGFVEAMELAFKRALPDPLGIKTPLMTMAKADIIMLGFSLGVPFQKTWSCYTAGEEGDKYVPCHRCDSCRIRDATFARLGTIDPGKDGVKWR